MRLKILLPAVFYIITAKAQDTLVLTPSMAVSMALENNNAAKNSTLMLSAASAEKWSAIQINPAEMTYRYGHLYSDDNSRYLQISQNIGSLPEHIIGINLSGAELDKASAEATIRKKELVSNVKSAYYRWIYQHSMVKLLSDRQKTLMELAIYFEPDTESTTSNTIRYYEIESLIAEAETDLVCGIADMEIAANELR